MIPRAAGLGLVAAFVVAGNVTVVVPAAQAAAAPACVASQTWSTFSWKYARATNYCSGTKKFKFVWAFAFDGSCNSYGVDASRTENRGTQSRFDGLRLC